MKEKNERCSKSTEQPCSFDAQEKKLVIDIFHKFKD